MSPEKLLVNRFLQVIISFSIILVSCIFLIELVEIYKQRRSFSLRSPATRWRLPLAGTSFFCLTLLAIDGSYEWINWTADPAACYTSAGFITMCFVFMKQCLNLFLYDRAKIVHEALQLRGRKIRALRWTIWLTIVLGVHVFFAWSFFLNFYGKVSTDTDCIYYTRWPEVIISFAVSDAALNLGMLLLFAVPLYLETQKGPTSKSQASTKIRSLMLRNMGVSLTITTLDIIALSIMTYFFMHTDAEAGNLEYRILWGNFAAVVDQLVVVIGGHSMTAGWANKRIREVLRRLFGTWRKQHTMDIESASAPS